MRYSPAAFALALVATVTASVGNSAPTEPTDPRAANLMAQAQAELRAGRNDQAIDALEAALTIQPGSVPVLLVLAEAQRRQGMQGKALRYYRVALARDPQNIVAIAGEGAALAEKGAVDKARRNLTRLQGLCGADCNEARDLAAVIARGPIPKVVSAESVTSEPVISEN